jgi:hypothetical protein
VLGVIRSPLALQSPFGVSANFSHQALLPTSGEQAIANNAKAAPQPASARRIDFRFMNGSLVVSMPR